MKAHFKYPRTVDGKHYAKGEHTLPDAMADHWFLKGLIESKDVTVQGSTKPAIDLAKAKAEKDQADADAKALAELEAEELAKAEAEKSKEKALPQSQQRKAR